MSSFSFRWLHFSDLHFGMRGQSPLWSNLKHHLFDDLPLLHEQSGPWDLVVFSGDIAQAGSTEDFRGATGALNEIYEHLDKLGSKPKFIAVPGNHDLVRPSEKDMSSLLLRDWHTKETVRGEFLTDDQSSYRATVLSSLSNYQSWYDGLSASGVPVLETTRGMLPGDQAATMVVREHRVGIVGLNSTWLQLSKHSGAGDLHIDHSQLATLLPEAEGWGRTNHFNIVITHQPTEWLHPDNQKTWKKEIAPPGRFDLHLFGHMHDADLSSVSSMGSHPVSKFQSPSLFGLETLDDGSTSRTHGFSAGSLSLDGGSRQLRIWPRTYTTIKSGQSKITPNQEFHLADNVSTSFSLPPKSTTSDPHTKLTSANAANPPPRIPEEFVATKPAATEELLARFRHHLLPPGPHAFVRRVEQANAQRSLDKRGLWIVADWGLSSDEFAASVLSLRSMNSCPVYRLDLSEVPVGPTDLIEQIEASVGVKIQELSDRLSSVGPATLLVDDIVLGDTPPGALPRELALEQLATAILDYCPELIIFLRTRSTPANSAFDRVQVGALDEAELRGYINNHPDGGTNIATPDAIAQLLSISGGVPERVDRALKSLKVVTLSELVASYHEVAEQEAAVGEQGLMRAINDLGSAVQPTLQRALQMLQALSTFPHGAQFEHVNRFNGVHGFYPENAAELMQRALIRSSTLPGLESEAHVEARKILSVPKAVRDAVRGQMSADLLNQHNRRAAELYFGSNWRAGATSWPPERKYSSPKCSHHEIANASAILLRLLATAIQEDNDDEVSALMHLAAAYSDALLAGDHYYGSSGFCAAFLQAAPTEAAPDMIDRVRLNYGKSLRMMGETARAITVLDGLDPKNLDRLDRDSLLLNMALAHEHSDGEKAKGFAEQLLKVTRDKSYKLQAKGIIIDADETGDIRLKKLKDLEVEARNKKLHRVANNFALILARGAESAEDSIGYLNSVVTPRKGMEDVYNVVRASVEMAEMHIKNGAPLSNPDHTRLMAAYQYLFIQRLPGLFDRCHRALWQSFVDRGEISNLFALFRHSSFIWRIRNELGNEDRYVSSLNAIAADDQSTIPDNKDGGYYRARVQSPSVSLSAPPTDE